MLEVSDDLHEGPESTIPMMEHLERVDAVLGGKGGCPLGSIAWDRGSGMFEAPGA